MFEEMITEQLDPILGKEYSHLSDEDKSYADLGLLSILAKSDPTITVKRERFIKDGKIFDRLIVESPLKFKGS